MNPLAVIEGVAAVSALGTLVFAAGRFAESVKANTKATDKLSDMIDGHLKWSAEIVREHDERFHDQASQIARVDARVTVLEGKRR
jgi:hypothetical protein